MQTRKLWLTIPCLLLTIGSQVQVSYSQQFVAAKSVSTSTSAGGVFGTGDVNHDGKLDIIAYDGSKTTYVVLLGKGDGTFTEKVPTTPISAQQAVKLGDVNGDGYLDLVTADPGQTDGDGNGVGYGKVTVYLGDASGDFHQTFLAEIGAGIASLVLGDVNGDGHLDVITNTNAKYQGTGNLQVFLNAGSGTFQQHGGGSLLGLLATADLNGDGKADLVGSNGGGLQIELSNGDGTFTAGSNYLVTNDSFSPVVIADFNKDGHKDLAVVDGFFGKTTILLGKGDGTFTIGSTFNSGFFGFPYGGRGVSQSQQDAAAGADFNHDGNLDLVTYSRAYFLSPTNQTPSTALAGIVAVNLGNGDGTFRGATNYSATPDTTPGYLATGDFNGDGNADVLVGGFNSADIFTAGFTQLLAGTKSGSLQAPVNTLSADPFSVVHADFNHDGIQDIAVVNQGCGGCNTTVSVYLGSGKGFFSAGKTYTIGQTQGSIAAGDINGDGKMDLVVTRATPVYITPMVKPVTAPQASSSDDTSVLLGNGDGTFRAAVNSVLLGPQTGYSVNAFLVDMNRDGKLDLVGDWGVALGKGDGNFQAPKAFPSTIYEIDGVGIGDLNGDGIQDVVAWDSSSGQIETLLGNGSGAFKEKSSFSYPGYTITDLKVGKIYGGTERDIVFCGELVHGANHNLSTNLVVTQKGNGDGTFAARKITVLPNLPLSLSYGDYNRDGKVDVVAVDRLGVQYLRGTGAGAFNAPQLYPGTAMYLQSIDVNGDGALDVVGITPVGFERLLNTGKQN